MKMVNAVRVSAGPFGMWNPALALVDGRALPDHDHPPIDFDLGILSEGLRFQDIRLP